MAVLLECVKDFPSGLCLTVCSLLTLTLPWVSDAGVSGLPHTAKWGFRFLWHKTASTAFAPVVCLVLFPGSFPSRLRNQSGFICCTSARASWCCVVEDWTNNEVPVFNALHRSDQIFVSGIFTYWDGVVVRFFCFALVCFGFWLCFYFRKSNNPLSEKGKCCIWFWSMYEREVSEL